MRQAVRATDTRYKAVSHRRRGLLKIKTIFSGKRSTKFLALGGFLIGAVAAIGGQVLVGAAACPAASADYGTDTITVNVPSTTTYTIWTRMKAPDASHNTISLQVDTTDCFSVGGGSFAAPSWTSTSSNWVNYIGGAPSNKISLSLSAGNHTVKYIGTQAGVEVDRIIASSDVNCIPVGTGNNCQSGDSTAPTVNLIAPTNSQSVSGTVNFSATASDASGILHVLFLVDGQIVNTDTSSPYGYAWNSGGVTNGSHTVQAQAVDNAGNSVGSAVATVTVSNAVPCTGTPTVPTNLRVTATAANSVSLAWNASTAATGCTLDGYKVYRGGTQVTLATGTSYTDSGLSPGTVYSYTVAAVDTSGHAAQSGAINGTTAADTTAPTTPTNLHTTLINHSTIALAWNASTDNTAVTSYLIYRGATLAGTSTTTAFTDSGLTSNTTYSYTVKARDAPGNTSPSSSALSAQTLVSTPANNGDLNSDTKINLTDLSILLSHWNQNSVPVTQGDTNADGTVNLTDLSILLSHWAP